MERDHDAAHQDGPRLPSSSSPRREWSRRFPAHTSMPESSCDSNPICGSTWRQYESFPEIESMFDEEFTTSRETQVDHQLVATQDGMGSGSDPNATQPSVGPSQPVLVRAFTSDENRVSKSKSSIVSPRRLFPFFRSQSSPSSAPPPPPNPPFPSDKDFSIDNILLAIDREIGDTLDSIAEICGRSKLSLANEYGSHIAPLGEIRASSVGGLRPVDEASSNDEQRAADGSAIGLEGDSHISESRERHPLTFFHYVENGRYAGAALESNGSSPAFPAAHPANLPEHSLLAARPVELTLPAILEYPASVGTSSRSLLGHHDLSGHPGLSQQDMSTPAIVSEVYLDAQDNERCRDGGSKVSPSACHFDSAPISDSWTTTGVIRSLLGWLKSTGGGAEPNARSDLKSAEDYLRDMLRQATQERTSMPATSSDFQG
ncbi:hypothetical protein PDE_09513 [Penicillium oxalicum 114-2]|uniref:Uncharacterized protein n=1 Tax=Penicillium oxalicum (strain 114-2 / CGMCC 5302) TaxID=933388 RepID=S7ZVT3_PENO1|nr:hypothetical protein PDE_09513 [Penicillium oxalicum 114-2]